MNAESPCVKNGTMNKKELRYPQTSEPPTATHWIGAVRTNFNQLILIETFFLFKHLIQGFQNIARWTPLKSHCNYCLIKLYNICNSKLDFFFKCSVVSSGIHTDTLNSFNSEFYF